MLIPFGSGLFGGGGGGVRSKEDTVSPGCYTNLCITLSVLELNMDPLTNQSVLLITELFLQLCALPFDSVFLIPVLHRINTGNSYLENMINTEKYLYKPPLPKNRWHANKLSEIAYQ